MSNTNCLLKDEHFIKFSPQLNTYFRNVNITLLLDRLEYWFTKNREGFFKFMEPCNHNQYRQGDSWTEELSWSRRVFNKAFDKIGIRYKSKTAFDKAQDTFQGKLYASYYDRDDNKTYYFKNYELAQKLFAKIFSNGSEGANDNPKEHEKTQEPLRNDAKRRSYKETKNTPNNFNPSKSPFKTDEGEREDRKLKIKKEKKPKEVNQGSSPSISDEDLDRAKKMHEIWVEATRNTRIETPKLSVKVAIKLANAFKWLCRGSLDWWRRYCRRVVSSQFLAGKITNFALWLVCAIQPKWVEDVKAGKYGVDSSISLTYYDYEKEKREREERHKILIKEKTDQDQRLKEIEKTGYSPEEATLRKQILTHLKVDQYHLLFENAVLKPSGNRLKVICANSAIYTLFQEAFRSIGINDIDLITQDDENMLNEILALDCSDTERAIRLSLFDTFSDFYASHFRGVKIETLPEETHMVCQDEEAFCSIRYLLRTLSCFKDAFSKFNINLCVA